MHLDAIDAVVIRRNHGNYALAAYDKDNKRRDFSAEDIALWLHRYLDTYAGALSKSRLAAIGIETSKVKG